MLTDQLQSEYLHNAQQHETVNDSEVDTFINQTLSDFDDTQSFRSATFLNPSAKILGNRFRKVDPDSRESFFKVNKEAANLPDESPCIVNTEDDGAARDLLEQTELFS